MTTAIIMVGAAGSGKSTWVYDHVPLGAIVCSADAYFLDSSGEYRFDPSKLGAAYAACMRTWVYGLQSGTDVVCDNTNSTIAEIAPYIATAQAYGFSVEVVVMNTGAAHAIERGNVHGVPAHAVERQAKNVQKLLESWPPYWPTFEVAQ